MTPYSMFSTALYLGNSSKKFRMQQPYIFDHESDPGAEQVEPPVQPPRMNKQFINSKSAILVLNDLSCSY